MKLGVEPCLEIATVDIEGLASFIAGIQKDNGCLLYTSDAADE